MHKLSYTQKIPISINQAWDFFTTPTNLRILTPQSLKFEITSSDSEKIYPGQIIQYTLKPLWKVSLKWITEITHVQDQQYFIDEQRLGPYKLWHHEHHFKMIPGGTEISDKVYYCMPYGWLGEWFHQIKVKSDLEKIFAFREKKLKELFGPFNYQW